MCYLHYVPFANTANITMFSVFKRGHYCSACAASNPTGGGAKTVWVSNACLILFLWVYISHILQNTKIFDNNSFFFSDRMSAMQEVVPCAMHSNDRKPVQQGSKEGLEVLPM